MYRVNDRSEYEKKCIAGERILCASFTLGGWLYDDKYINKISFEHNINTNCYGIGAAPAAILKMELNNFDGELENARFQDNDIRVSVGVEMSENVVEMVPMGVFIISEVKKSENRIEITAYDKMIMLEKKADISLSPPFSLEELLDNVAVNGNIGDIDADTYLPLGDMTIDDEVEWSKYTFRQIVGFIAEICCSNAFFTKEGKLKICKPSTVSVDSQATIGRNSYFKLDMDKNEAFNGYDALVIRFVNRDEEYDSSTSDSNYIYTVSDNPLADYMTNDDMRSLDAELKKISFLAYELEWRGIPTYEINDCIRLNYVVSGGEKENGWAIDENKALNEGYPFIEGLVSEYGDIGDDGTRTYFTQTADIPILAVNWNYNGGFRMDCSASKVSQTTNTGDNNRASLRRQVSETKSIVEKIERGENKQVNNVIVEVTRENVVAADIIEATSAFIEDMFVDKLETNIKPIKCIPNIQRNAETGQLEWIGGTASYTIPAAANNIRAYIRIEGMTIKFIEAHLTASGTRDLKVNNKQVYYTSIADDVNAYKYFTFTDPKTKYPDLTNEEAAMFKVVVRSSENEYEKAQFKFEPITVNGVQTYDAKIILGTGDANGHGKLIYEKAEDEARIYINSRTESGRMRGIAIKDDGLYQIRGSDRSNIRFDHLGATEPSSAETGDIWYKIQGE